MTAASDSPFEKGLDRVTGIVARSESFRRIVGHKIPDELVALHAGSKGGDLGERFASQVFRKADRIHVYDSDAHFDILCYGRTENNLKEFAFLADILSAVPAPPTQGVLQSAFSARRCQLKTLELGAAAEARRQLVRFVEATAPSVEQLWQCYQYARTYLSLFFTFRLDPALVPRIAVVANDHSPAPTAFKAVMEEYGVPIVYLQHAEVSPSFPALDFAMSILRNEASRRIYEEIGTGNGTIFVVSRADVRHGFRTIPEVRTGAGGTVTVGLYPTSTFEPAALKDVAAKIAGNPHVSELFTKLHPNSAPELDDRDREVLRPTKEIPETPHIAIVGNSSVTIELLSRGVPVYHLFMLDDVDSDYYGFVESGLAAATDIVALGTARFWEPPFYDADWLSRASRYGPESEEQRLDVIGAIRREVLALTDKGRRGEASPDSETASEPGSRRGAAARRGPDRVSGRLEGAVSLLGRRFPHVGRRVAKALLASAKEAGSPAHPEGSGQAGPKGPQHQAVIGILLEDSSDPFLLANMLLTSTPRRHTSIAVIDWFDRLWANRDPRAFELVRKAQEAPPADVDPWLRLVSAEITSTPVSPAEAELVLRFISAMQDERVRQLYETKAIRVFLKNGLTQATLALLRASPGHSFESLSGNAKVSLARLLMAEPPGMREEPLAELSATLSDFDRLKLCAAGIEGFVDTVRHVNLVKRFIQLVDPKVAAEFNQLVLPAYEAVQERLTFPDIRCDMAQRQELQALVHTALATMQPFSILRLGDGEAYIFGADVGPFTDEDREMRERHWWNVQLTRSERDALAARSLAAYRSADIVGLPTIHRFIRDFAPRSATLLADTSNRGIVTSARGAADLGPLPKFSEERLHHLIFDDAFTDRLVATARRTIIVSSVVPDVVRRRFGPVAKALLTVELPTHAKTFGGASYVSSSDPLPLVLQAIEAELARLVEPGDLVLVGGGVAGKTLVATAKAGGAVAIDIGGQIEALVGFPNGAVA